jgi:hypothetical protein
VREAFTRVTGARQAAASTTEARMDGSSWPNPWPKIL